MRKAAGYISKLLSTRRGIKNTLRFIAGTKRFPLYNDVNKGLKDD
jgi:hypothetical protein